LDDEFKKNEMVDACGMHGREDMYRVFVVIQRKLMASGPEHICER